MPATMLAGTTASLFIEDNTFCVADPTDPDSPMYTGAVPTPDLTGLIAVAPGFLAVTCGLHLGDLTVTVEVWDGPPEADLDRWDDVAEASVTWPVARVQVTGAATDDPEDIPVPLPESPADSYRVRVAVTNRDAGEDRTEDDPVETYLIQIWAAPLSEPVLMKATDEVGALWRKESQQPGTSSSR